MNVYVLLSYISLSFGKSFFILISMLINYTGRIRRKYIPFTVEFNTPEQYNDSTNVYFKPTDKEGYENENAMFAPKYILSSSSISLTYENFKNCYDKTDVLLHVYIKDAPDGNIKNKFILQRLFSHYAYDDDYMNMDFTASATVTPNNAYSSHIQIVKRTDGSIGLNLYTIQGLNYGLGYYVIQAALANKLNPAVSFELSYI